MHRKNINISTVLAGQFAGLTEIDHAIWLVMYHDLGHIDLAQKTLQPFGTWLPPMS